MEATTLHHLPAAEEMQEMHLFLLLNEPLVLLVRLVPVAVLLLRLQLLRQLLENHLQQLFLARLVLRITVPDRDLDRIPADGIREAADVVVESWS